MINVIIKISKGNLIKSKLVSSMKLVNTKLTVILPIKINEFAKLLIKAPRSPLTFAKYVIYNAIRP